MINLRQLTCEERIESIDPDASTSAPWPEGRENDPCTHRCEEDLDDYDPSQYLNQD